MATGRVDEAMLRYERVFEINPENVEVLANLGVALAQKKKLNETVVPLERAVALDPEYLNTRANLGGALLQKKKAGQTIPHLEKAVTLRPGSAQLQTSFGLALLGEERMDEAIACVRRVIAAVFCDVAVCESFASTLHAKGRTREALVEWRLFFAANFDYVPVLTDAAWVLATSFAPSVRDGPKVVVLAERAVRLTEARSQSPRRAGGGPCRGGTVHRGERRRARSTSRVSRAALLAVELDGRLTLYRARRPYRASR
jgi:tetratricopeptide (TPR) repeat protein